MAATLEISPVGVVEGPNCNRAVRRGCMGALWHADTGRAAYVGSWAPRRAHMATHNRDPGTETETQSPPCRAHRDPVLRTETQVRATETQAVVRDSATETQAWVVL